MKPVCLVLGAGAGLGGNVAKRFANAGYHAALFRRSDEEGLQRLITEIQEAGGSASGELLNAVVPDDLEQRIAEVEANTGPVEVLVYEWVTSANAMNADITAKRGILRRSPTVFDSPADAFISRTINAAFMQCDASVFQIGIV